MKQIILIILLSFSLTLTGQPLMGIISSSQNNVVASVVTSYSNTGGHGDRTAIIAGSVSEFLLFNELDQPATVVSLFNGNLNENIRYFPSSAVSGKWILFDFGASTSKVIDEVKFYQQDSSSHGVWQWQGSNDASTTPTNYTNIGATFTLGGASTQIITVMSGNITGYRHYRLLGVSGNSSSTPWIYEFEFKIN